MSEAANVRVLCRFRPINGRERKEFIEAGKDPEQMICKFNDEFTVEIALEAGLGNKKFVFDRVYPPGTPQRDVYNLAANDTVVQVLQGYNGTILSYGQTGAGKSFSMYGADISNQEMKGIIPRSGDHIFQHIRDCKDPNLEFNIRCAFIEIYNESINDLLARGPEHENLKIRETPERGIFVEGATETQVCSVEDIITVITIGDSNRAVGSTSMNAVSSRSHTVIIIFVQVANKADQSKQEGKMCLVDLAGSEKVGKTGAEGQRLQEANNINSSLTTLGQCIKMLADGDGKAHIPYRTSKLTRLLQESLGGNSKTTLLIACSPHPFNREETISTCEFGKRAKAIKNKVKVNATKSVKELMAIIDKLTIQIAGMNKYIDLQTAVIEWYKANVPGQVPACYVPNKDDLKALMEGKKIAAGGAEPEQGENGEDEMKEAGEIADGDVTVRIASLQSQLEKEREANKMLRENFEADMRDMENKLKEAQDKEDDSDEESSDAPKGKGSKGGNEKIAFELQQVIAERNALKKQLLIALGEEPEDSESYEDEYEDESEEEEDGKPAQPKQPQQKKDKPFTTIQFGGKKIQELNRKIDEVEAENEELQSNFDQLKTNSGEEIQQLNNQLQLLRNECNRLRGISDTDGDDSGLDEKDKVIRSLEKEVKALRETVAAMRHEQNKSKLLQQRLDQAQDKFVKAQTRVQELEDVKPESQTTASKLERTLQIKNQEIQTFQQRLDISDQRMDYLQKQLVEQSSLLQKLKKEKQDILKQKEEDARKLLSDFESQKQKLQDNMLSKAKVYKPVSGTNVAQQLAASNPDIIQRLKAFKSGWCRDEQENQ
ncbi:Kinesin-like_protein [Hexamita inflata]|uniref:Kinesin-like protein n=1 Tax=Hexamita inflata TaxID=28002 RepID=A0ABP1I0P7_9EUKA